MSVYQVEGLNKRYVFFSWISVLGTLIQGAWSVSSCIQTSRVIKSKRCWLAVASQTITHEFDNVRTLTNKVLEVDLTRTFLWFLVGTTWLTGSRTYLLLCYYLRILGQYPYLLQGIIIVFSRDPSSW